MSHASRLGADSVSRTLAHNRLGVPAVVFFVISAATPLTVVAGVITTGFAVTGIIGLPIAFVAMALLLALFSVGYVAMSRHITNAGAFYTYVTHGLGRPAGVGAAWMALFAYNASSSRAVRHHRRRRRPAPRGLVRHRRGAGGSSPWSRGPSSARSACFGSTSTAWCWRFCC